MLRLHHTSNTRSARIVWLLEELGLDYELNRLEFHPSALKSDEHRARHPLGRIPVLEDGDTTLYESGAIIEYVVARHSDGRLRPAPDSAHFAEFLQWFHYSEGMVMPPVNTIVVHTRILPEPRRNEEVLGQAQRLLTKALAPVDEALTGREYLVGEFTSADIQLGHALFVSNRLGCVPDTMAEIRRYIETIAARPAFQVAINA